MDGKQAFERFMVFAFRRGSHLGGADDFLVTANLRPGGALFEDLAELLEREGVDRSQADTIQLVEVGDLRVFAPIVCMEIVLDGDVSASGRIEPTCMRIVGTG